MKILALGPAGTNGHEAARIASKMLAGKYPNLEIELCGTNASVLEGALKEGCFGVAPIENSSAGLVMDVVKGFWLKQKTKLPMSVIGEIHMPIEHVLLVNQDIVSVEEITDVMSHPQALSQCEGNLKAHGLRETHPVSSTAFAAHLVASGSRHKGFAALASAFAGETYGLKPLVRHMEDSPGNVTRFHVVGPEPCPPTGKDRTVMIFQLKDEPCILLRVLAPLRDWTMNLSSIHSIPLGVSGVYAFYLEIDCHTDVDPGKSEHIFGTIRSLASRCIILGSFPQGEKVGTQ